MIRRSALAILSLASLAFGAQAQLFRAYLSTSGSDTNPCTLPAPCRLLPAALSAVTDGGEVWMLDSGNYNATTVTIPKSVSILSVPGAQGSIVLNNATAIQVSAAGLRIALRNVAIVPVAGTGGVFNFGIHLTGNSALTIDRCLIAGLPDDAIRQEAGTLVVVDTMIRDAINGWALNMIPGVQATASITGSRLLRNGDGGVRVAPGPGSARASVTDSHIVGAGFGRGAWASIPGSSGAASLHVSRTRIESTALAVSASTEGGGVAEAYVSGSVIVGNDRAFLQLGVGSSILSMRDNHVASNAFADTGTVGTLLPR